MTDGIRDRALPRWRFAGRTADASLLPDGPSVAPRRGRAGIAGTPWARSHVRRKRVTDAIAIAVAVLAYPLVWRLLPDTTPPQHPLAALVVFVVAVAWFLTLRVGRLPEWRSIDASPNELRRVVFSTLGLFAAMAVISVSVWTVPGIRHHLLITLPLGLALLIAGRVFWRARLIGARSSGLHLRRAVIVGTSQDVAFVSARVASRPLGYTVAGVVFTDSLGGAAPTETGEVPAFTGVESITDAIAVSSADTVLLAGQPNDGGQLVRSLAWRLESTDADLVLAFCLDGFGSPRMAFSPSDSLPMLHVASPVFAGGKHHLKRMLDILVSGTALLVLAPVFAIVATLVRMDSPGPAIFHQPRVGRNGSTFTMLKFRSMIVTAERDLERLRELDEGNGVLFKIKNDPRVTRIGAIIRRYSIDELPQLWNVFVGDMSLVGPRPPLATEVAEYEQHTHRRLYLKPGITGLWQVSGRSNLTWDESVRLDLHYVENWSVLGDIRLLMRTVKVVLKPLGAY